MTMVRIGGLGDVLYQSDGWTVCSMGRMVFVNVVVSFGSGSWDSRTCPYVLPAGLRPPCSWRSAVTTQNGGSTTGMLTVDPDGTVSMSNQGSTGSGNMRFGSLCFAATQ